LVRIDRTEYELHVKAAEGMVAEAEARLAALMSGPTAEGTLQRAQAALELAELDLERTEISFPYDSRVISSDVGVGELVGQQDEVGSQANMGIIYRSDALEIDAPIDLKDLEYLAPAIGRTAQVYTGSQVYQAEIMRISSVLAPQTRFASLFLRFSEDQSAESLPLPGTFVEIEIEGPSFQNVYVLPDSVLQDSDTVWVVRDGALSLVSPLAIGRTDEGLVVAAFDAGEGIRRYAWPQRARNGRDQLPLHIPQTRRTRLPGLGRSSVQPVGTNRRLARLVQGALAPKDRR